MAGDQTGFLTRPTARNTCALCVAIPSKFNVATVLPWTLSPAVLSCFGNLFTFKNFFIAAEAVPHSAWAQRFLERHTFCLHVSFRVLSGLGWCSSIVSGYAQFTIPRQVVMPGGQSHPGRAVYLDKSRRVTFLPGLRFCQNTFCAMIPHILNPIWSPPLPL